MMITLSCTLLGRYAAHRAVQRCQTVESILVMLAAVRSRLEFICMPVYDLLDALCADGRLKTLGFIEECRKKCSGGEPFPAAWSCAVEGAAKQCRLTAADTARLCEFGQSIGTTDLSGQLAVCELYSGFFTERLGECRAAKAKYAGMLPPLGFLGGLAVSVLLI